jgi:hypothetical protein
MKKAMSTFLLGLGILAGGSFAAPDQAEAQLLTVESQYRIVEVDRFENRIGIALPDANPSERQNWVYIKSETDGSMRHYLGNGTFRDELMTPNGILDAAESRMGGLMKIQGGRDFDGSIDAKKIWM